MENNLAQTLKAIRDQRGMSITEAAKRAGISHGHLIDLEAGRRANPTSETLGQLGKAYGVSPATLLRAVLGGA